MNYRLKLEVVVWRERGAFWALLGVTLRRELMR